MKKNFRTFRHNYFKKRYFELYPKSGGFYSLRSDSDPEPDPDPFFSEVGSGSGQNPPTLIVLQHIPSQNRERSCRAEPDRILEAGAVLH
jgi:hypothetical protein